MSASSWLFIHNSKVHPNVEGLMMALETSPDNRFVAAYTNNNQGGSVQLFNFISNIQGGAIEAFLVMLF